MSKTDQFDMALELTQEALERIVHSQHAVGVLKHTYSEWFAGERVDLVINSPTVVLEVSGGSYIAHLDTRVFCNIRNPATPEDLGDSAVADVAVQAQVSLVTGNPTLVDASRQLRIDWTGTTAADITVHTANAGLRTKVQAALLRFLVAHGINSFVLPPIGPSDERIGAIGFRFRTSGNAPTPIVGMNVGSVLRGTTAGIDEYFVQRDWALAISRRYFLDRFRDLINDEMPLPQTVASRCTMTAPWLGCVNTTTVKLTSLSVDLRDGYIRISGHLDIHNSGALVPDASANFTAHVTLDVTNSGSIVANVGSVSVDASLFGEVIDFFTGDVFSDSIADAVGEALQAGAAGNTTSFFKASTINSLATGNTARPVNVSPSLSHVAIASDAVILHGDLHTPQSDHEPEPAFVAIELPPPDATHRRFLFNAHASWAPGSTIAKYEWRYSDAQVETFAGTNCRFLTIHDFPLNWPTDPVDSVLGGSRSGSACLTVTDALGRSADSCAIQFLPDVIITVCHIYELIPERFRGVVPRSPRPPIPEQAMQAVFVRPPTMALETLPLIAAEDPSAAFRRPIGVRPDDPGNYGFAIDLMSTLREVYEFDPGPTDTQRERFNLGGPKPPDPPDLDVLFPDFLDEFYIQVCLMSGRMAVSNGTVELVLPTRGVVRAETDAEGHAAFIVKKSGLKLQRSKDEGSAGLARARLTVVLVDEDARTTRTLWLALTPERKRLVAEWKRQLLDAHELFLNSVGGREFFISGEYRIASVNRLDSVMRVANAIDRLLNIVKLLQAGSAITPVQRLLGLSRTSGVEEIAEFIRALFADIEKRTAALSKSEQ